MASQKFLFLRKLSFNFVEAALPDGLQPFLERLIVITLPIPVPQTPHALYRAMFLYIVAAFGIGWFLPVNGVLWGILLATALVLYLRIRSLARGEKRLYDRFPTGKSGISSLQWLYLMIAVTGMVVAFCIPLVLTGVFCIMEIAGIDLHKVSLGALIIALGLLVDESHKS